MQVLFLRAKTTTIEQFAWLLWRVIVAHCLWNQSFKIVNSRFVRWVCAQELKQRIVLLLFLGGHSLLATQMISRLKDEFGLNVPLTVIFESPTIAELADCLCGSPFQIAKVPLSPPVCQNPEEHRPQP